MLAEVPNFPMATPNTFTVGDLQVIVVSDGVAEVPATVYYPGTTTQQWEPHKRWLDHEGRVHFPFACFLVNVGGRRVLIDTGLGTVRLFTFTGGELLTQLASAGVRPEDIDIVFVTHLHVDHCGTCVADIDDDPRPVFPNAVYRWTADESAYWRSEKSAQASPGTSFPFRRMIEALTERFDPADGGTSLAPGIDVIALPGHTPGHAGVVLSSNTERAFILGDAISCPAQLEEPEWSGLGDIDPKLARRTQEAVAKEIEGTGALAGASHFPGLTFGRVLRGVGRRYWEPLSG